MAASFDIGADIGGTFTDVVMLDRATGSLYLEKVLTTPDDPSAGVLDGVRRILTNNAVAASQIRNVIHGTTLVANALIERKGVKTALLTTRGFRDTVEIGRESRYDIYDLFIEIPKPLVPRTLRFGVRERIAADGSVVEALDRNEVEALASRLEGSDVQAVAVSFLHAYRNGGHETAVAEIFARRSPRLQVCLSSEVMPEIGEYERTSTTIANAYVQPVFHAYVARLAAGLKALGVAGDLYLMLSDGGTVDRETAARSPIRLVQSGPAGGARATSLAGRLAGAPSVMCFDMGGTTAKCCLIEKGEPTRTTDFEVARLSRFKKGSGLPLKIPTIEMIEIGAGGGSIARVNRLGMIEVGPESSGAKPGPACYGLGGTEPTVTDADLVLGYLDAGSFLGGDMALHPKLAERAIAESVARPLGISVVEAAWGIHDTVNENMSQAANIHALEKGKRASDFVLVPIGGAGPVHAAAVARKLAIRRVVAPAGAGVASAFGFLASPMSFRFVQAAVSTLADLDMGDVRRMLETLESRGRGMLRGCGVADGDVTVTAMAAMRYVGQGHEIDVPVPIAVLKDGGKDAIGALFQERYEGLFGRSEPATPCEIISWRIAVSGPDPVIDLRAPANRRDAARARKGERPVFLADIQDFATVPVFDRYALESGVAIAGPAIVEERESTMVVPPGASVLADRFGNLAVDLDASNRAA